MFDALVVLGAFLVMEPATYAAHRWVMHGFGRLLHDSHHRPETGLFELNDLYPVMFASVTIMAMAAGSSFPSLRPMLVVGIGVTAYGMAYMFVHDVYIHRRLPFFRSRWAVGDKLAQAHRIHHLYGGEPYGMLLPIVPRALRARSANTPRDPLLRRRVPSA